MLKFSLTFVQIQAFKSVDSSTDKKKKSYTTDIFRFKSGVFVFDITSSFFACTNRCQILFQQLHNIVQFILKENKFAALFFPIQKFVFMRNIVLCSVVSFEELFIAALISSVHRWIFICDQRLALSAGEVSTNCA